MSIISDYRKQKSRQGLYQEPETLEADSKTSKILDLTYLKKLIGDVLKFHKTEEPFKDIKDNRKWAYVERWRLQNLLGYVDTPTFVFMLESALEWCIDSHSSIQPNGKWELFNYEIKIEQVNVPRDQTVGRDTNGNVQTQRIVEGVQYLVIGFEFVDINGNQDLQYDMGRPKANSDQAITPQMLKQILESQGSKVVDTQNTQREDKYKEVIENQQTRIAEQDASLMEMKMQMTQMQEMVAGLITELQTARNSDIVDETIQKTPVKKRGK